MLSSGSACASAAGGRDVDGDAEVDVAVARVPGLPQRRPVRAEMPGGLGDVETAQTGHERETHAADHGKRIVGGRRHPDRGVRLLIGPRHHGQVIEREIFARVREPLLRPGLENDVERFLEALAALVVRHAVPRVGARKATAPDAEVEAPLADLVDGGGFLGGADGVTQRRTLTPVPIRSRLVRAAMAAASTSGTEAIDGMPAPMGSVGLLCMAKCRSASQTPSSPWVSAISAMDIASANASSCVLPSR